MVRAMAARLIDELLAVLAPPSCAACRAALERADGLVCPACLRALPWLRRSVCPRCALPDHGARHCPAAEAAFARAWSPLRYDGVARSLVGALKFRAALPVAELMAAQLAANLPGDLRALAAAVVPVPPQPSRRRQRGFDPTAVLASAFARRTGRELVACLARRDRAARQLGARRSQRLAPDRIRLELVAPAPAQVLLLDDVHTTGATLEACARALRAGGSQHVVAIAYARTP